MSKLFTLSKSERLKSQKDIETLFQNGKAFFIYPYRVLFALQKKNDPKQAPVQVMVSVPKKHFRKATQRNRIRRQVKEAYRLQNLGLKQKIEEQGLVLQLVILYQTNEALSYEEISVKLKTCLDKLLNLCITPMA
jgi:ribonuclease P protein component